MMYLVIKHWVAPAISIKFGLSWSVSSPFFRVDFLVSWDFPFSDMKLLRTMSTVILYNVICDCLYFWEKINIS